MELFVVTKKIVQHQFFHSMNLFVKYLLACILNSILAEQQLNPFPPKETYMTRSIFFKYSIT